MLEVDLVADHDELVAAEAGHGVAGPHGRAQALPDLDQHVVARRVAVAVVDLLEVVDVDEEHAGRHLRALGPGERMLEPVAQQRAVGEPGQRVVQRLVAHPLLAAQPRQRRAEDRGHGAHEARLVVGDLALEARDELVLGSDLRASSSGSARRSASMRLGHQLLARPARPAPARRARPRRAGATRRRAARRRRGRWPGAAARPPSRRSPSSSPRRTPSRRGEARVPRR